ncbi:MFS transporter [Arthrobacter sp. CAU 1506]|uniref:MFS transporter n=1 Tax=Arthrobacter sp. CAU 1506 TaxID=2560052 RepID=UPI0010AD9B3D|nr:MFS transporter [Arthrobacter sp. CAU 1506]TJY66109.1 MFS transporter [Arthrobacter sp. CAU 1506]
MGKTKMLNAGMPDINNSSNTSGLDADATVSKRGRRAWMVVAGSAAALSVSVVPLFMSTSGVFLKPISDEFGWSRGAISAGVAIGGLLSVLVQPMVGSAIDKWGVRRVVPVGVILMALNLAALAVTPAVLGVYVLLVALLAVTGGPQNPVSYVKTVARWVDRRRGLAIGLAVTGVAIGQAVIPQYAQYLVGLFGWRAGYFGLAALLLIVALPSVLGLVRDPKPGEVPGTTVHPLAADQATQKLTGISVRSALRNRTFWLLASSVLLATMVIVGTTIHAVPLLTDNGWSPAEAAGSLAALGMASIAGRIFAGLLYDRFHAPKVGAIVFAVACLGIVFLASGTAPIFALITIGFAAGAETDLIAFLASRYFGLHSYSQLTGYLFGAAGIGTGLGPVVLGTAFDVNGTYTSVLFLFAGALLIAAALLLFLPKTYPFPTGSKATESGNVSMTS